MIRYNDDDYQSGFNLINKAKIEEWKVCVYGLGMLGAAVGKLFPDYLGLTVDYYSDKNPSVLNSYDVDKNKKITYEELMEIKENVLILLFIGFKVTETVKYDLESNKYLHCYTYPEMVDNDEIIKGYFDLKCDLPHLSDKRKKYELSDYDHNRTKRIAVFTCIVGDYDPINEPLCVEDNCDYYLITDNIDFLKSKKKSIFNVISISEIINKRMGTSKDQNRYCKMHGFSIFKDYKYSIYLDGSLQIVGKMSNLINKIGKRGLGFFPHLDTKDSYIEALSLSIRSRIQYNEACAVVKKFLAANLPRHFGCVEGGVIVCDNQNNAARMILSKWYEEYMNGEAKRDQLYLPYVLFRMGIPLSEIMTFQGDMRDSGIVRQVQLHVGYQR